MKRFKIGTILQLIYCLGCLIVVISMLLYTAFHTTTFGKICFKIGEIFTVISTFNPMGLIGVIMNFTAAYFADSKKRKEILGWSVASSIFVVLCWAFAVSFFVGQSGGV